MAAIPAINYDDEIEKCRTFIETFEESIVDNDGNAINTYKYRDILVRTPMGPNLTVSQQRIANRETNVLPIELEEIEMFEGANTSLSDSVRQNTRRYRTLFEKAVDAIIPAPTVPLTAKDPIDILMEHRITQAVGADGEEAADVLPAELRRRYEVHFIPGAKNKASPLRAVRSEQIGNLVTMRGVVIRITEVKPLLCVATYVCDKCPYETYQEIDAPTVMPLTICNSPGCVANQNKGRLTLETRGSKFIKFQEIKLQERPSDVPQGEVPMMVTVHARGENTRLLTAGDWATVSGIWMGKPMRSKMRFRQLTQLLLDPYLEATHIEREKKSYSDLSLTEDFRQKIEDLQEDESLFDTLASSIAPEIYGHNWVKKALLLQLVSGVTKVLGDGVRLRGDINICLMGDPAVAKSQLLRHIATISPRGVYTTGKGSSGVGLTAALIKDPISQEMTLEGGALVLADNGICCIDEFDKMDEIDRTAIHEVMEQQTVSIAKASITTTLNARAAVLAAANPLKGRYDKKLSPAQNLNLAPSLLSRFDLMFVILDSQNEENDHRLAMHITNVHMHGAATDLGFTPLDPLFLRHYIAEARRIDPYIPRDLTDHIVVLYNTMRSNGLWGRGNDENVTVTPRTLLSIIRLAQAAARLRFSDEVTRDDIDYAYKMIQESAASLDSEVVEDEVADGNKHQRVYTILSDLAARQPVVAGEKASINLDEAKSAVRKAGLEEYFDEAVEWYTNIDIWNVAEDRIIF